jgi:acetyltransferase-like isoleucine patch superfamily enzyme
MKLPARWQAARVRRWLRACAQVGESPVLAGRPSIFIEGGKVNIGNRFRLASTPVGSHMAVGPEGILDIGDDVSIGCGAAVAALQHVRIGDGTLIGPFVIIMDTNFHGGAGDQSVQHDCRPVTIGSNCRIGSRVTIMRGVTIGDGAEILAGSVVTSEIPAGACAAGGRARIIGRAGESASRWESPAAALPDMLMAALDLKSPPDLDDRPIPEDVWTGQRKIDVLRKICAGLGVAFPAVATRDLITYADIAGLVTGALRERASTPRTGAADFRPLP